MTQHHLQVREHGYQGIPDEVADAVPGEFWSSADCEVSRRSTDTSWTLHAGNNVGVAKSHTDAGDVILQIRPKLDTADVFFLADYAYEQRHDPLQLLPNDIDLEAVRRDPTACLLAWHTRAIRTFAARWLRRDYQTRIHVLDGKVKGKILVNRYVSAHLAVGEAAQIPCRVQERTQDTPNNRLLKAGLRYIATISYDLPVPAARRAVLRQVNAALPLFANVTDVHVTPQDIRATSSRGPQRHYKTVLNATIGLLENRFLSDQLAPTTSTSAFMWRMPVLFQEGVRGIVSACPGFTLDNRRASAHLYDATGRRRRSSKVDPDIVVHVADRTLLIDTKYKDVLPSTHNGNDEDVTVVAHRHRIKISRSDIYQMVAYCRSDAWPGSTGVLLYPVELASDDPVPAPMSLRGLGPPISLLFIDIGRRAASNLPAFVGMLRSLVEQQTHTAR